ncbi:MAG: hypothetical protein AAFX57_01840 [Bacteroidota bacterium]
MSYLSITGLVLNVIGSIFFIIDTNQLSNMLASMVKHMAKGHGKFDSRSFSKEEIGSLEKLIKKSKLLTVLGYSFFLLGFTLQLASFY